MLGVGWLKLCTYEKWIWLWLDIPRLERGGFEQDFFINRPLNGFSWLVTWKWAFFPARFSGIPHFFSSYLPTSWTECLHFGCQEMSIVRRHNAVKCLLLQELYGDTIVSRIATNTNEAKGIWAIMRLHTCQYSEWWGVKSLHCFFTSHKHS